MPVARFGNYLLLVLVEAILSLKELVPLLQLFPLIVLPALARHT